MKQRLWVILLLLFALGGCAPSCAAYSCYQGEKTTLLRGAHETGTATGNWIGSAGSSYRGRPVRAGWALSPAYNSWLDYTINSLVGY